MPSVIVKLIDGLIRHEVAVVEEKSVKTETVGKLEVLGNAPLVLRINTGLMELHACGRIHFAIVSVGEADHFRGISVDEVVDAVITVVTGTVPHVGVVSHLVLITEAHGHLVVAGIVHEVIFDVGNSIMYGVVPGEEFVSERHVRSVGSGSVHDINERELR